MGTDAGSGQAVVRCARIAALIMALVAWGVAVETASAQSVRPEKGQAADAEAADKKAAAQRAYEAGVKAFEAGKTDAAVKSLSEALKAGGLPSEQVAKALYYRGIAYRKQRKSAQAIADLTSAVWLKNGLTDSERADATENRSAAYRDAGISATGERPSTPMSRPEGSGGAQSGWQTASTRTSDAATPPPYSTAPTAPTAPAWQTSAAKPDTTPSPVAEVGTAPTRQTAAVTPDAPAPPPSPAAPAAPTWQAAAVKPEATVSPPASPAPAAPTWQTTEAKPEAAVPPPASAAPVAPPPPAETGTAPSASSPKAGGIAGFFSNLFGGSEPTPAKRPDTPLPKSAPESQPEPVVSSWSKETTVSPPAKEAAAPVAQPDAPGTPGGVQVATVEPSATASSSVAAPPPAPVASAPASPPQPPPSSWSERTTASPAPAEKVAAVTATARPRAPEGASRNKAESGGAQDAASSWSQRTTAAPAPAAKVAAVIATAPQAAPEGAFRIQVETVRPREQADALAERLRTEQGAVLGDGTPTVDEAVFGKLRPLYRVSVGPYRTAAQSEKVCRQLQTSGYECAVVTQ